MKQKKEHKIATNVAEQHKIVSSTSLWEPYFVLNSVKGIYKFLIKNLWVIMSIVVLTSAVFFNSLKGGFVSDDIPGFVENPTSQNILYALKAVRWQETMYAVLHTIYGINPTPLHAASIVLHIISVILFFILISNFIQRKPAILASLLFSVHPMVTESVDWISASNYLIFSIFASLCGIFFVLFRNTQRKLYLYISLGVYMFMVLTNHSVQSAFIMPMIVVIDQFLFEKRIVWKNFKYLSLFFIPAILVFIFFLTVYKSDVTNVTQSLNSSNTSYFYTFPYSIFMPLRLLFFPDKLTLYHDAERISIPLMYSMILITMSYLYILYKLLNSNRKLLGLILLGHASFLFMLSPIQISWFFAERYIYFSTGIFCTILALFLHKLDLKTKKFHVGLILFLLILFGYSYRTYVRNFDWENSKTLWESTIKIVPNSARAYNNIGDIYSNEQNFPEAEKAFQKAIELNPNYPEAIHNLGQTYLAQNKLELAEESFLKAVELNPYIYQSYLNLAIIKFMMNDLEKSNEYIEKALALNPDYENALRFKENLAKEIEMRNSNN